MIRMLRLDDGLHATCGRIIVATTHPLPVLWIIQSDCIADGSKRQSMEHSSVVVHVANRVEEFPLRAVFALHVVYFCRYVLHILFLSLADETNYTMCPGHVHVPGAQCAPPYFRWPPCSFCVNLPLRVALGVVSRAARGSSQ